jgi:hypothetical protein
MPRVMLCASRSGRKPDELPLESTNGKEKIEMRNLKWLAPAGVLLALGIALGGCSDATMAKYNSWGNDHRVKVFSGGELIGEYCSTGKIENDGPDGYYFQNKNTGQLETISGDVQITIGCD